jgi:hypothetical protein
METMVSCPTCGEPFSYWARRWYCLNAECPEPASADPPPLAPPILFELDEAWDEPVAVG